MKKQIERISTTLEQGQPVEPITVRELLRWFGVQRRGQNIVTAIRSELEEAHLETLPDFESAWIGGSISFHQKAREGQPSAGKDTLIGQQSADGQEDSMPHELDDPDCWISEDPAYRISKLESANTGVVRVPPDAPLAHAVTEMIAHDFSQLAVSTGERDLKGVISWKSIGSRLSLNKNGDQVKDYIERSQEVRPDASIFDVIGLVVRHDYVIVRGEDRVMTGIVTASDLSEQFHALTEPFLLLSEIENMLRNMIGKCFNVSELQAAKAPNDQGREVKGVTDMTFGEYIRLLENSERWEKLQLAVDRCCFCDKLQAVRKIRNSVMHFDPDGIEPRDLTELQTVARFLKTLDAIGAI